MPGAAAAIIAFAVFGAIAAGSIALARRNVHIEGEFGPSAAFEESADGSKVEMVTVMAANRKMSAVQAFKSCEMVTIAGNGLIDLTEAQMAGEKGDLEVVVLGGHAQVRVPEQWEVESKDSFALAGALRNRATKAVAEPVRKLRLEAVILGGELEVTH